MELADLLLEQDISQYDTSISWVGSHSGINGNEEADKLAAFASALGQISLQPLVVTEGGYQRSSKPREVQQEPPPVTE